MGGLTIAQKLDTAIQPDMPETAIASGYIDFILSPEDIAKEIERIAHAEAPTTAAEPTARGAMAAPAVSEAAGAAPPAV